MSDRSPLVIRVATYNIHRSRGLDGRTRPQRIADVLQTIGADVIALQEVENLDVLKRFRSLYLARMFSMLGQKLIRR